jgi:hypothetical protein
MVIVLEVAGLFEMHATIEEVRTHVTTSPLIGVYVKVVEFVPEFIPFTFH